MQHFSEVCKDAATKAGNLLREMLGKAAFREKGRADLITEADTQAQEMIQNLVKTEFPEHRFLGEESPGALAETYFTDFIKNSEKNESYCWIVDPLDGTTNFVHQVPFFCTSIALARGNDLLCGAIYNPVSGEFFFAEKGAGAFLNEERLSVSRVENPGDSLVAVGFPTDTKADSPDLLAFQRAIPIAQAIRRTGSTALNLAYLAAGRFDAMWGFTAHSWDVAAGILLIREAGGVVCNPKGTEFSLARPQYIAAANLPLLLQWRKHLE